jgi:UDP-N-acetyl-D-galactosamine dehydrogenase
MELPAVRPGLVGGHCIGVDPYYLTHKAEMVGYHPEVILAGRRINDGMGKFVAEQTIKHLVRNGWQVKDAPVVVLGLTFKEDCADLRNSPRDRRDPGAAILRRPRWSSHDPVAAPPEALHEYGVELVPWERLPKARGDRRRGSRIARSRREPASGLSWNGLLPRAVIADVKSQFNVADFSGKRRHGVAAMERAGPPQARIPERRARRYPSARAGPPPGAMVFRGALADDGRSTSHAGGWRRGRCAGS